MKKILFLEPWDDQEIELYKHYKARNDVKVKNILDFKFSKYIMNKKKHLFANWAAYRAVKWADIVISSYGRWCISSWNLKNFKTPKAWFELWHGTPIKSIYDRKWLHMSNYGNAKYFLVESEWTKNILQEMGWTNDRLIIDEYPRIERYRNYFLQANSYKKLNLSNEFSYKSLVLTWTKYERLIDLDKLLRNLKDNEKLIVMSHENYIFEEHKQFFKYDHNLKEKLIFKSNKDTNIKDIYNIINFLWTDFSSAIFDFSILKGKENVAFFRNDVDDELFLQKHKFNEDFKIPDSLAAYSKTGNLKKMIEKEIKTQSFQKPKIEFHSEEIDVVYYTNAKGNNQLYASLKSLLKHNKGNIKLHIISEYISPIIRNFLNSKKINYTVYWKNSWIKTFNKISINISKDLSRFSLGTLYRFALSEIDELKNKKVLCLDIDTYISGGIGEIFRINLNGNPVGAVPETAPFSSTSFKQKKNTFFFNRLKNIEKISYSEYLNDELECVNKFDFNKYFNVGVLLLDTNKYFELINFKTILQRINNKKFPYLDQDIINFFIKDSYFKIDRRYNATQITYQATIPDFNKNKKKWFKKDGLIFHFVSGSKHKIKHNAYHKIHFLKWLLHRKLFIVQDFLCNINKMENFMSKKDIKKLLESILSEDE